MAKCQPRRGVHKELTVTRKGGMRGGEKQIWPYANHPNLNTKCQHTLGFSKCPNDIVNHSVLFLKTAKDTHI